MMSSPSTVIAQAGCSAPKNIFLNPFSKQSAHHRPIGTGAQYAGDSHPATRDWLKASSFAVNVGGPWGVDVAEVGAGDPVMTVQKKGGSGGYGLPQTIRLPDGGLKTKVGYNALGSTDGVAIIYDSVDRMTHQLRNYEWNNGKPVALQYLNWSITGLGHGTRPGQRIGTSASGVAALFGILRGHEINAAGYSIDHALQIALPRRHLPNQRCNIMLSKDIVPPATTRDGSAGNADENTGNIPYGALLALPSSVSISALGLSEPGTRLARALRDYGMYVVDGGGCGGGAIRADQFVSDQTANQLRRDIPKIYRHIRMVLNNDVLGSPVAGGGSALAPNCAVDGNGATVSAPQSKASTQQASANAPGAVAAKDSKPSASQSAGASGNSKPKAGTAAAADWAKAVRFYDWAMMSKQTMDRTKPGSADYNRAKANYDRNITNYVVHANRAGVTVTADIPPNKAFEGNAATASTPQSKASTQQASANAPGAVAAKDSKPSASQSAGTSGNSKPKAGTAAAANWAKAVRFYDWSMTSKQTMSRTKPGSADYDRAKANYDRNIKNYVEHAKRAGVTVTADMSPSEAFG
jgi:hypothetical protein